jgi:hypothetical protein
MRRMLLTIFWFVGGSLLIVTEKEDMLALCQQVQDCETHMTSEDSFICKCGEGKETISKWGASLNVVK